MPHQHGPKETHEFEPLCTIGEEPEVEVEAAAFLREVERRAGATRARMLRGTGRVHANHLDNDADSQECADWLRRILGEEK